MKFPARVADGAVAFAVLPQFRSASAPSTSAAKAYTLLTRSSRTSTTSSAKGTRKQSRLLTRSSRGAKSFTSRTACTSTPTRSSLLSRSTELEGGAADRRAEETAVLVARPVRLEPTTSSFEGWHSIQLSYGRVLGSTVTRRKIRVGVTWCAGSRFVNSAHQFCARFYRMAGYRSPSFRFRRDLSDHQTLFPLFPQPPLTCV